MDAYRFHDVFSFSEFILGFIARISQPYDVEIIGSGGNLLTREELARPRRRQPLR